MNTAILISSLRFLTVNFAMMSKLAKWIQQTLVTIHYTNKKLYTSVLNGDIEIVEQLFPLARNLTVMDTFSDQFIYMINQVHGNK